MSIGKKQGSLMPLWYLASPYSHADAWVRELRFKAISRIAGMLYINGKRTFCPIAHSHPISEEIAGKVEPTDHLFWLGWDQAFEPLCTGLIIAMLPGWEKSKGVSMEIPMFEEAGKEVIHQEVEHYFTGTEWQMLKATVSGGDRFQATVGEV